jgi:hypothetical protein
MSAMVIKIYAMCLILAMLLPGCQSLSLQRTLYGIGEEYRLESCRKDLSAEHCNADERVHYDEYQAQRLQAIEGESSR